MSIKAYWKLGKSLFLLTATPALLTRWFLFFFTRSSLMEVKQDLQERTTRWRQIESLCGFSISTNPGLSYLETLLRSGLNSSRFVVFNPCNEKLLKEGSE
jgi:hypothetical protein